MKIIAATGPETILVEMDVREMRALTDFKWNPDPSRPAVWTIDLRNFVPGQEVEIFKVVEYAKSILDTFRSVVPGLRQNAARLNKLASEVELHEPDYKLLPKENS